MIINEVRNEYEDESSRNLKMSDFTLGERKDEILKLCLKHPKQEAGIKDFKRILFPNASDDDIKYLLTLISKHEPKIINVKEYRFDIKLSTNEQTKPFIDNDGFTKLESDLKKDLENNKVDIKIDNFIGGDNYGVQSSKTDFKRPISIKTKAIPNKNPVIKSRFKKTFSNPWVVGLTLLILATVLNADRIMNFINEYINNL